MEIEDVVMKLVGPVTAVGECNADAVRYENLNELTELIDNLINRVRDAAMDADRHEASMKKIGVSARDYLRMLGED